MVTNFDTYFDTYSLENALKLVSKDDKDDSNIIALKPVLRALNNIEDIYKDEIKIFIADNCAINIDGDPDYFSLEDTIKLLNKPIEELTRDKNFENYIILLKFHDLYNANNWNIKIAQLAESYNYLFYSEDEEDIDNYEGLLFIYGNRIGNEIFNILTINLDNDNDLKDSNNIYNHKYYISYFVNTDSPYKNNIFRSMIVNLNNYITSSENISSLIKNIAESEDVGIENINIIAFSLMESPESNNINTINNNDRMTMYMFKITYLINGEEKELTQGVDIDILSPGYRELNLALSLVRDLDEVNDDDEVEIIDVEALGSGHIDELAKYM